MIKTYKNGEEYYNKVYLLFNLFIAASLLPFGYLLLLKQSGQLSPLVSGEWYAPLVAILLLASAAVIFQANKTFNAYLEIKQQSEDLRQKLDAYKAATVKKNMAFFLACMICVCGLYLTTSGFFIVGYIVSIILLSIKRQTLNVIIEDLKLNDKEQNVLIERKEIL